MQLASTSPEDTQAVARKLLPQIKEHRIVALHGELGAGKTCFVQGLAAALGLEMAVTSPTYTLINEYRGEHLRLYHVDTYRLNSPEEGYSLGLEELFESGELVVIEWAERIGSMLPEHALHIQIQPGEGDQQRWISIL